MKKMITIAGLALALTVGAGAMAQGGHGEGHHGPRGHGMGHHMMERMFSKLDLSEQQQEEVKGILTNFKNQMKDKRTERFAFKDQIKALVQSETFDEAAVRALIESKQAQRLEAQVAKARMKNQIWNVLNAEQQVQLNEMMENAHQKGRRVMRRMIDETDD